MSGGKGFMVDIKAQYAEVVRNLSIEDISRIQNGEVTSSERRKSPKLETACSLWEQIKTERALRTIPFR